MKTILALSLTQLRVRNVPVFAIDRLEFRTVDRHELLSKQPPFFAQEDKRTQDLLEGFGMVFAKIRNRFEVGVQFPQEPEQLDVPVRFLLQPAARAETMHVPVEVKLE